MKKIKYMCSIFFCYFILSSACNAWSFNYRTIDLGTGTAHAINSKGQIIGSEGLYENGSWTKLITSDGKTITPYDLNDLGQISGSYEDINGINHAVIWNNGQIQELGISGSATLINNNLQIAGYSGDGAFYWDNESGFIDLDVCADADIFLEDINDSATIVGYKSYRDIVFDILFVWDKTDVLECPKPPGLFSGIYSSWGYGINESDQIVGSRHAPGAGLWAIMWDPAGGSIDLGTLGYKTNAALGVNDSGWVVGTSDNITDGMRAFIWNSNDAMRDLNEFLPENSGWELTSAIKINNAGQILGHGYLNGEAHSFLMTPNYPPSIPQLIYPSMGQNDLGTTVQFRWSICSDPDGDSVTYNLSVCEDENFAAGCITNENIAFVNKYNVYYAGTGSSLLLFGIIFVGGLRVRKKIALLLVVLSITAGLFISCGNSGSSTRWSSDEVSATASGLNTDTTYFWKVVADDNNGGTSESEVRSFTTQSN